MALEEIREARIEKIKKIKSLGQDPYPAKVWRSHTIKQALDGFEEFSQNKDRLVLLGRVMAKREHGGSAFYDLEDGSGRIQVYFKKDVVGDKSYVYFDDVLDVGDFLEVSGFLFATKRGEKTLEVEKGRVLVKSLLPLPEKWHGLVDVEERYRRRYLDLMFNEDVKRKFLLRSKIVQSLRTFLLEHNFLEVTTPTLQPLYGGASARPFKTHLHALDTDVYLRIAPELYLKRLLVGGLERVFEFTTNFRNEGIDRDHNPEFSALEFYVAFKDYEWGMSFAEEMIRKVITGACGSSKIKYDAIEVDVAGPFSRVSYASLFKEHVGIDIFEDDEEVIKARAVKGGLNSEFASKDELLDEIFKKLIRSKLIKPTFVMDFPINMLPLAKRKPNSDVVEAFQFYMAGFELMKAFTELNDPIDQRQRFMTQETKRAKGDEEAQRLDEGFIEALEYGMPPAAGFGLGIDRFVALLTDSHSIREVILFPPMRAKEN